MTSRSSEPFPPPGQTIYEETRFQLRLCQVPTRSGRDEKRGLIIHPGAVVLLPMTLDGRLVLIRNSRWQIGQTLLELPAGTRERDEDPVECAHRELREETGYTAEIMEPLSPFFAAPGVSTEVMWPFLASSLTYVGQSLAEDEKIEVELMTIEEVKRALLNGSIIDGKTIAVLGRFFLGRDGLLRS